MDQKTIQALDKIHEGSHILYREIGRICDKYHIHYYLDSGNLIGAVREHDDIPWDDDADLAMTRRDFEVFRRVAKKELSEGFAFVEPWELDGAFFDFVPRVFLLDSTLRRDTPEEQYYGKGIHNHMCADFFIVDDVSDRMWEHRLSHMLLILIYGMCMGRRYRLELSEYRGAVKAVIAVLSVIGRLFPIRTLIRWYDRIGARESGKNSRKGLVYYHNCLFPDLGKVYKGEWFSDSVSLKVGDDVFPGPVGYDPILRTLYNSDYMVPPPPEKRTAPHCQPDYVTLYGK